MTGERLSAAQLEQRRQASLKHGAYAVRQISRKAQNHARRVRRHLGIRAGDLDALTHERLRHWARGQAQLDLFDATGERGTRNYWTAFNAVTRAWRELEARLRELGLDPAGKREESLGDYLERTFGANGVEEQSS